MNNRRYSEALRGEPTNGDVALFTAKTDCIELTDDGEATVTAAIEALQHQLKRVAVTELKGDGADWPVKEPVDSTSVTEYLSHFSYGLTPGEARYTIYCFLKSNNMNIPKALKDLTKAAQFRINQNLDKMALFPCLISISGFDQPSMCEELHIPFIHNLTSGKRYVDAGGRLRLEQGDMDYYNVQYADIYAGLAADAEQPTTASLSTPNALKDSVPPMESNIAGRSSAGQRRTGCVAEESNGSREEPLTSVNSCHGCTRSRKDSSNGDNNTSNSNGNGIASGWRSFIPFRLFGHAKEKEKNGSPSRGTKSSDGYQRSRVNSDLSVSSSCCNSSLSGDDVADDQSTTSQGAVLLNPAATGEALAGSPYTLYADSLNFHGILGPIVAVITKHVPFAFHYWDREGHPIMYCRMDGLNSKRLMRDLFALTPINSQPRALAQLFNAYALGVLWQLIRYANIQSRKGNQIHDALLTQVTLNDRNRTTSKQAGGLFRKKPPVGSCVVVVDCAGLRLHRYLYKPLLVMIKSIVSLNVQLYPELLHHAYITNCRTAMSFSYLVIRSMLSEETRQKVTFCSRHNSASTLLENISSELLPQQLGGKCHCPGGCIPSVTAGMPGANQRSMRSDRGETRSSSMSLHSGSSSLDQTGDRLDELTLHRLHRTVERLNLGPHVSKTLSFAMDARTEIIWEFVVKRKQKVTFSAVFVSATDDGAMLSLVPRRRVQSDAGHYICPSYGTVILRWSNKRSYFRRCRVNLKVYREDQAGTSMQM
ncbi:hypothetical protein ABL78_0069 [Leptomonas seymouri]|uniref:CRAL-TRIO domain-containing protein n=1 Tax=Leptomonas seymouri TaxID=5684 RepID=A0A0N0P992_LEPSE|nr:hypothetical protein ABL78_0069 [Leptomonas seymouri]|eukprot:KPI90836.1 hypothetical protein ABL78_0069 [Leptomonas seymouri]